MRRITVLAITLLLFGFSSVALAADPNFYNVTMEDSVFSVNPGDTNDVFTFEYDFTTGGPTEVAVFEQVRDLNNNIIYEFGGTGADDKVAGHYTLEWDGTYKNGSVDDGEYVSDGKYKLYLFADTHMGGVDTYNSPSFTVSVVESGPTLQLLTSTDGTFDPADETFDIDYELDLGPYANVDIILSIFGPLENEPQKEVIINTADNDGDYTISWDGTINGELAPNGEYTFTLQAETNANDEIIKGNIISDTFTLMTTDTNDTTFSPSVFLNNLSASPDPYNPSTNITFKYSLNGSSGNANIDAAVYDSNDTQNALKSWKFTNQSSGSNSIVWNGVDKDGKKIGVGGYIFKVWGVEDNKNIVPQQTSFTVQTGSSAPIVAPDNSSSYCAYPDVASNDVDCEAIKWAKAVGVITGNANGQLQPNAYVQRDQMAKIVLELYGLAKPNSCESKPFSDVELTDWAADYICRGVELGIIFGNGPGPDEGTYRSGRSVNHAEFTSLLLRPLIDSDPDFPEMTLQYNDVEEDAWYAEAARVSRHYNLLPGNDLHAGDPTTRREAIVAIYNLHKAGLI